MADILPLAPDAVDKCIECGASTFDPNTPLPASALRHVLFGTAKNRVGITACVHCLHTIATQLQTVGYLAEGATAP